MKIKELHLLSNNLIETEKFYNTILDIPAYKKAENEIVFAFGETLLFFKKTEANSQYHIAFDIPNNQLEEAYTWLKSRIEILPVLEKSPFADFESWNAKSFYFYDNNSNLLEFIVRYDLDNRSENTFNSSSILYASEIGIVTDDVPSLAKKLQEDHLLSVYSKQPPQENFIALGDETGLLIIVNQNRNWFPTDKKAIPFPSRIIFGTENSQNLELTIE